MSHTKCIVHSEAVLCRHACQNIGVSLDMIICYTYIRICMFRLLPPPPSPQTMAAGDLRTTIYTLHLYIYYVWAYLKRRDDCVPHHVLDAADTATYKVAMRLNETTESNTVNKLGIRKVLVCSAQGIIVYYTYDCTVQRGASCVLEYSALRVGSRVMLN